MSTAAYIGISDGEVGMSNARPSFDHFRRGESAPIAEHVNCGLRQNISAIAQDGHEALPIKERLASGEGH